MTKEERQKLIIDVTKEIVSENCLDQFTVRFITQRTGINEALVYRDFDTKDGLLFACYQDIVLKIHKMWAEQLDSNKDENPLFIVWSSYFSYLLSHPNDTFFVFYYRQSSYLIKASSAQKFKYACSEKIINRIGQYLPPSKNQITLWRYLIDVTLYYATKILKKEIPYKEDKLNDLYQLLYNEMSFISELKH